LEREWVGAHPRTDALATTHPRLPFCELDGPHVGSRSLVAIVARTEQEVNHPVAAGGQPPPIPERTLATVWSQQLASPFELICESFLAMRGEGSSSLFSLLRGRQCVRV
jgi:hypothetical protein